MPVYDPVGLPSGLITPSSPQKVIMQTTSVWTNSAGSSDNFSWSRAPIYPILLITTSDAALAAYTISQTGYEWNSLISTAPTSAYGDCSFWLGMPTNVGPTGTLMTIAGNVWFNAFALEIKGLKGEVVYTNKSYNTTSSIVMPGYQGTQTDIVNTAKDADLLFFIAARMKSGGSGVTGFTSVSGITLNSIESGNWALGMASYGKYIPFSKPRMTASFTRSTNSSAGIVIIR